MQQKLADGSGASRRDSETVRLGGLVFFRAVRPEGTALEPRQYRPNGNTWAFHSPVKEVNASSFRGAAAQETVCKVRGRPGTPDFDLYRSF